MSTSSSFTVELEQQQGYEFRVKFDAPGVQELLLDEPAPLGGGRGPNAARLVAAAVANCLSASLVFCLAGKFRQKPGPLRTQATAHLERNERGRYRIARIDVKITLAERADAVQHVERCGEQFEDFCIVTESIRGGIPVSVEVVDSAGLTVHRSEESAPALA
ncbi:MAG: OsmC family protein [Acidobacteriia bacterium]|nr:OsmC family protein [Terriglobia bacterium]